MSATVLVTGASGFIGAHLARRLRRDGHDVRALDVRPLPPDLDGSVSFHRIDLRDTPAVRACLDGVDMVFHLASTHLEVHASPRTFEQVNVAAAAALAHSCVAAGVTRLIHTSSVGVYGHVSRPPAAENAPLAPRSTYERTKLAGERAVLDVAARYGLDVIVLRPAWVYGPGCGRTAKLLRSLTKGRFVFVGDGSNLRHPLHVDDLLDAYALAAAAPPALSGRVYNIAGPRALRLDEMIRTFADAVGAPAPRRSIPRRAGWALGRGAELVWGIARREPPFSRRSLAFFENDNAYDTSAARRDLGFTPRVDLAEGLRRTGVPPAGRVAA